MSWIVLGLLLSSGLLLLCAVALLVACLQLAHVLRLLTRLLAGRDVD